MAVSVFCVFSLSLSLSLCVCVCVCKESRDTEKNQQILSSGYHQGQILETQRLVLHVNITTTTTITIKRSVLYMLRYMHKFHVARQAILGPLQTDAIRNSSPKDGPTPFGQFDSALIMKEAKNVKKIRQKTGAAAAITMTRTTVATSAARWHNARLAKPESNKQDTNEDCRWIMIGRFLGKTERPCRFMYRAGN